MKHLRLLLCAFLILTMALSTCGAVAESTGGAVDPTTMTPEELVQYYQAARAAGTNDRLKQWYDPAIFDLSDLPEYNPDFEVSGTIRQWGSNYIEDSGLVQMWEAEFKSFHPDVVFEDTLTSSANAFPGLITGQADSGQMGRVSARWATPWKSPPASAPMRYAAGRSPWQSSSTPRTLWNR